MRFKKLIVSLVLVTISMSGCSLFHKRVPDIIHVGDCERGIVTDTNLEYVNGVWPQAQVTDILISGGCYQEYFIKKK